MFDFDRQVMNGSGLTLYEWWMAATAFGPAAIPFGRKDRPNYGLLFNKKDFHNKVMRKFIAKHWKSDTDPTELAVLGKWVRDQRHVENVESILQGKGKKLQQLRE